MLDKNSSLCYNKKAMKYLTDMHSHTYPSSHDAVHTLREMFAAAQRLGVAFFGVSNHFDYDYNIVALSKEELEEITNGDEGEYFHEARRLQEDYQGVMNIAVGVEFGYSDDPEVQGRYAATYEKYRPDYVINSVHGGDGTDFARTEFTQSKREIFSSYLRLIRNSLDAPYPYDIVGHLEYVVRYVPFAEKEIALAEFGEELDDILQTIIAKNKILEVNTATKALPRISLPSRSILERYYALGGRNISYGSDAHGVERICDKREEVAAMLKDIGFTHLTVPFRGEYIKVEL